MLSVHVKAGAGRSHQQRVGISDKAGQYRHAKALPHRRDLCLAICGLAWNPFGADLAFARPDRSDLPLDDISVASQPMAEASNDHLTPFLARHIGQAKTITAQCA